MMAMLNRIGSWLWAGIAALIGVLLFALKFMASSRARWKEKARQAEAEVEFQDDLRTLEVQNDEVSKARRKQSEKEMENGEVPSVFKRHTDSE